MEVTTYLIMISLLGFLVGTIAERKGHSFILWFFYGAGLFIFAFIHVLLLERTQKSIEGSLLGQGHIKCPSCAEMIKAEAKICRHCKTELGKA